MSVELANALAKRFIARGDAKAKQGSNGQYSPVRNRTTESNVRDAPPVPWSRQDVIDHVEGRATYGHYLLDSDNTTKLFALDIDLEKTGLIPFSAADPNWDEQAHLEWEREFTEGNPRESWRNRAYPGRTWMKTQFREIIGELSNIIVTQLDCECAVAYSGSKGVHVYGFTGRTPAADAVEGAELALQLIGGFKKEEGNKARASTWKHESRWGHLSVEVYPKQMELTGGGFGNLMRLPLGKNLRSPDPAFFIDMTAPMNQLVPVDPLWALTEGATKPWASVK